MRSIMAQLIKYGEVRRSQLGVMTQNVTSDLAEALNIEHDSGAMIAQVVADSAAKKPG